MRILLGFLCLLCTAQAQVAIKGKTVYTMTGKPLSNAVVLLKDGKIEFVGQNLKIPKGYKVYEGEVVTPGLVDAHSVVGLAGSLNVDHDQDQVEKSKAIQPELEAIHAYNAQELLVTWLREHGVTTIHTGHAPLALLSGQTMIVKTTGNTVNDAMVKPRAMLALSLTERALNREKKPGTRAKMMAMLRQEFIKAQEYLAKQDDPDAKKKGGRDLAMEALGMALKGELQVMITAQHTRDIINALALANEFSLKLVLDGGAEAYLMMDEIKAAGVPVFIHPTMARAYGEMENMTMESASILKQHGIPVAIQSGYESYVPKSRVILFEAAIAAANGLGLEGALEAITLTPAKILGIDDRVGSLEAGKDGDVVIFDGDPFEYQSHVRHVFINGEEVSSTKR